MKWIVHNLAFKILSLILSVALWLFVRGELERGLWRRSEERMFPQVPISILSSPEGDLDIVLQPNNAKVVIEGYTGEIENVSEDDIILFVDVGNLFVDLGNLEKSEYELPIQHKIPTGLTLQKIDPPTLMATLKGKTARGD